MVLASVAVTVTLRKPEVVKVWVALVALVESVSVFPSPQFTDNPDRLEPGADAAVMVKLYETPVFAVVLPETVTVGCERLTVTACVALAVAVLVSVAVTVMVGVPAAVKMCVAVVALVASVSVLPSPQFTDNPERLEPAAAVAVILKLYETPVLAVGLPEMLMVGCERLTVTAWVALALAVLVSTAITRMVFAPTSPVP